MSKKTIKLVSVLLIILMAVLMLSTSVFAETVAGIDVTGETKGSTDVQNLGRRIIGIVNVVGVIAAVLILMILGIKYMMGSAEEKADYKKTMIPYVIGAVLLFAAPTIINMIYSFVTAKQ